MTPEQMHLVDQEWGDPSESILLPLELSERLRKGRMTTADFGMYVKLHQCADPRAGICTISIPTLMSYFQPDPDVALESVYRGANRSLKRLQENGFLAYAKVTRKPFSILLHKYLVRVGVHRGQLLDAFAPGSLENPVYVDEEEVLSRTLGEPAMHPGVVQVS
jgi:hypothetical protein